MKALNCSIYTTDKTVENLVVGCIQSFDCILYPTMISGTMDLIEKMSRIRPDILFVDCDCGQFKPKETLSLINKPPFIIAISKNENYFPELHDAGFFDCISPKNATLEFCKIMSRILNILQFYGSNSCVKEKNPSYSASTSETKSTTYTTIRYKKVRQRVAYDDIAYIEQVGNYLKIIKSNGSVLYHNATMKQFYGSLPSDKFVRVNKSIIVNYNKIQKIDGNTLYLKKISFPISRVYSANIKSRLKNEQ